MLAQMTLEKFTQELSSRSPAPGGGSAAALSGALSAALVRMVCELTIGREKYKEHEERVQEIRLKAEGLHEDLLGLVDRDTEAFEGVMRAIRMPKETEEEKRARSTAIAKANLVATETPMATAEACAALLPQAIELAHKGNANAISDVGAAALLAYGGLRGAAMNVHINLGGIGDEELSTKMRERVRKLEADGEKGREEALRAVFTRGGWS